MTTPIIRLLLLALAIAIVKRSYYTISFTPTPIILSYNQKYATRHMICTNRVHMGQNRREKKGITILGLSSSTSTLNGTDTLSSAQSSTFNSTTTTMSNSDAFYFECNVNGNDHSKTNHTIAMAEDLLFTSLLNKIEAYSPQIVNTPSINNSSIPILQQTYQFAKTAHDGQCRLSGEPYIIHPLKVAHIIADMKLDLPSLLCAILHDTVEDTSVTLEDISTTFGEEIAVLVDGVTKVGQIPITWSVEQKQSENYRKLILSMSRDIRVLLVKLADRTHNMRTLEYMSNEKQIRISRETLDIYVPLAHRLGIYWLKTELEDNCFKYLYPTKYQELYGKVEGSETERKQYEDKVVDLLLRQMTEAGMDNSTIQVTGRTKGLYSIYTKMKKQDLEFNDVHDVLAFRIIVDDVASCYSAMGIVHSNHKPVPRRIKDYIALPKSNGYRSLHTTIFGPGGRLEVQIRTHEMHEIAESGIAAHWLYKEGKPEKEKPQAWLKDLVEDVRQEQSNPKEVVKSIKEDLYQKEVFVFSPNGDLFALARGSTVLDFAFKVHTALGSQCVGAKVNGKQVSIKRMLKNGDAIDIVTSKHQSPKREWLNFVRTSKAKNRIKSWLKRQEREKSVLVGKEMIDKGLKRYRPLGSDGKKEYQRRMSHLLTTLKLKDEVHLLTALGDGQLTTESVMVEVFGSALVKTRGRKEVDDEFALTKSDAYQGDTSTPDTSKSGIVVGKERNIMLKFCKNCNPLPGEEISGVVSNGLGVKIHRHGCKYLNAADEERIVDSQWDETSSNIKPRPAKLEILCEENPGVLACITKCISSDGVNIGDLSLKKLSSGYLIRIVVMVATVDDLNKIMTHLRMEDDIILVSRR